MNEDSPKSFPSPIERLVQDLLSDPARLKHMSSEELSSLIPFVPDPGMLFEASLDRIPDVPLPSLYETREELSAPPDAEDIPEEQPSAVEEAPESPDEAPEPAVTEETRDLVDQLEANTRELEPVEEPEQSPTEPPMQPAEEPDEDLSPFTRWLKTTSSPHPVTSVPETDDEKDADTGKATKLPPAGESGDQDKEDKKRKKKKKKDKKKGKKKKKKKGKSRNRDSLVLSDDIISETLAELLTLQGHREAAKAMYEKLMLIYPEKSSFFALKIEELSKNT